MKQLFLIVLLFCAAGLFAAPLEGGYALAPRANASADEKAQAYINARQRVITASRKYLGTPYRYGGMAANGVDCSGFLGLSFRDALGVTLPRSASGLYTWAVRISLDKAQPGDFLFFKTDNTGNITHVALYLGNRQFIHAASAGSQTGVIYSSLDERYWSNAFAGAGRAFPEAPASFNVDPETSVASGGSGRRNTNQTSSSGEGRLLVGVSLAPIWNTFVQGGDLVRGVSSGLSVYADTYSFGTRMVFGLEVRPEYDGALEVFRLPITFSWGPSEKIRVFAGPVFSYGDASLSVGGEEREYSGGTSWLGTIGFTIAPFVIPTSSGDFAPYVEAAWQSYISESMDFDLAADFSAGFRFSTGIRWLIQVR